MEPGGPLAPGILGKRSYRPYILRAGGSRMADRAKLFKTGGSQAVRLPRAYRFQGQTEVLIKREGTRVVLEGARRAFSRRFLALAGSAKDFPYPPDPPAVEPGPQLG
jgi:antitoxin VapB